MPLWLEQEDQTPYYYNPSTGSSRWDRPTLSDLSASPPEVSAAEARAASEQRLERLSAFREQVLQPERADAAVAAVSGRPPPRTPRDGNTSARSSGGLSFRGAARAVQAASTFEHFSRSMSVADVCAWLRGTELAALEHKMQEEEVDGEMLALYVAQSDHTLLKTDLGISAGRARALHSTLREFVDGTAEQSAAAAAAAAAEEEERRKAAEQEAIKAEIKSATDAGDYHRLSGLVAQLEGPAAGDEPWHDDDFEGWE